MNFFFKRYNFFLTAALLISCCLFSGCENSQKEIEVWTKKADLREEARNIQTLISQNGKMKAILTAPTMYRDVTPGKDSLYIEFPHTMHVDFYNDSTVIDSWLDCRYGKYYESLDKVYLRDSVVVISVKGDTLKCQDLWWDQKKGLFYSDKYARYIAKGQDLRGGRGLEATQDMKTVTFREPTGTMEGAQNGFGQR